jgi:hypothetical protein
MQQVYIHKITISKKGQQHFFQINLPKNAAQIIGIETGVTLKTVLKKRKWRSPLPIRFGYNRNMQAGLLQLKAMGTNQTIYADSINITDSNIGMDDLVSVLIPNEDLPYPKELKDQFVKPWASKVQSHCTRKEEDSMNVCGVHTIYCSFTDALGKQLAKDVQYKVQLYIWTNETTAK